MRYTRWYMSVGLAALAALVTVPVLYASGLLERDQRRLDRAREMHAQEIERAVELYTNRVERANETVQRVFEQTIDRYEERGEQQIADQLRRELDQLLSAAVDLNGNVALGGKSGEASQSEGEDIDDLILDDEPMPNSAAHAELIESIGPALVNAQGRLVPSSALAEANYVVLFFTAQWCGPCRRFTPDLVEFHRQFSQRARLAVIYVSSDRNVEQMMQNMQGADMPWHAVPYHRVEETGLKQRFNPRGGIPNVVVLDREGNIVLRSTYPDMPPLKVLHALADQV